MLCIMHWLGGTDYFCLDNVKAMHYVLVCWEEPSFSPGVLKVIKRYNNLDEGMYKAMYSTGYTPHILWVTKKSIKLAIL